MHHNSKQTFPSLEGRCASAEPENNRNNQHWIQDDVIHEILEYEHNEKRQLIEELNNTKSAYFDLQIQEAEQRQELFRMKKLNLDITGKYENSLRRLQEMERNRELVRPYAFIKNVSITFRHF
jgi:predicted nuclease with TOPRIM domain